MGLRARLVLSMIALAVLAAGGALVAVDRYLAADVRTRLRHDLERGVEVYAAVHEERTARRGVEAWVIAEEPRLKALVRTAEVDEATLLDVSEEMKEASRADLFALTDRLGQVTADVSEVPLGASVVTMPGVADAAKAGQGVMLWRLDVEGKPALFQVVVRVLKFGLENIGLLVTGYQLGEREALLARPQVGCEVVLMVEGEVVGAAFSTGLTEVARKAFIDAPEGISEAVIAGERFLIDKVRHPGTHGIGARLVLARSVDTALAEHVVVRLALAGIGAISLFLALGLSLVLARNLTRRVEGLSTAAEKLGAGDFAARVPEHGTDEIARLAASFNRMAAGMATVRKLEKEKESLQREMKIAQRIQTALLPDDALVVPGYRVAGKMVPAEDVGGDYYDVMPKQDGMLWLAIGDVTSHGLTAGLIMMMVETAVAVLTTQHSAATPSEVLTIVNHFIYHYVRERMRDDNYMTITLFRSSGGGKFQFAGAHLDIAVRRANGQIEWISTPGIWIGVVPEFLEMPSDETITLAKGDVMVLYTDGLTEARAPDGMMFDNAGVESVLKAGGSPGEICQRLFAAVGAHMATAVQDDDISVLVVERTE